MSHRAVLAVLAVVLVTLPAGSADAQRMPGSGRIAFTSDRTGNMELWIMDADGGNQTRLTWNGHADITPSFSPDGRRIAWAANPRGTHRYDIMVRDLNTGVTTNLTQSWPYSDRWPTWSPDGSQIVFMRKETASSNFAIYRMNADGTGVTRVVGMGEPSVEDCCPSWSPDGQWIAFASNHRGNFDLYRVRPDGRDLRQLTTSPDYEGTPSFGARGAILFRCNCSDPEIWRMTIDGTARTRLTNRPGLDRTPQSSPDGTRIVYSRTDNGNDEIYVMGADGSNPVNLTRSPGSDVDPTWQPRP